MSYNKISLFKSGKVHEGMKGMNISRVLGLKGKGDGGDGGGVFCKYRKTESVPLSSTEIKLERRKHIVSVQFSAVSLLA